MPRKQISSDFDEDFVEDELSEGSTHDDSLIHPDLCGCGGLHLPARPPGRDDDRANYGIRDEDDIFADDHNSKGPRPLDSLILR